MRQTYLSFLSVFFHPFKIMALLNLWQQEMMKHWGSLEEFQERGNTCYFYIFILVTGATRTNRAYHYLYFIWTMKIIDSINTCTQLIWNKKIRPLLHRFYFCVSVFSKLQLNLDIVTRIARSNLIRLHAVFLLKTQIELL